MPVRVLDANVYGTVYELETLLRKILRWELRGHFGQKWLNSLGTFGITINDRIAHERRFGVYNPDHSELAYLEFGELSELIFKTFWSPIFQNILRRKSFHDLVHRNILPIRNKVAHFRAVDQKDVAILNGSGELRENLRLHYTKLDANSHLSGEDFEGQIDETEVALLKRDLQSAGVLGVWDQYGMLDGVRVNGLSPGIGVVDKHLFFELFTADSFAPSPILKFAKERRHDITFLNFGAHAEYVRFFAPLACGEKELCRLMRAFTRAVSSADIVKNASDDYLDSPAFDIGYLEHVIDDSQTQFSFVF